MRSTCRLRFTLCLCLFVASLISSCVTVSGNPEQERIERLKQEELIRKQFQETEDRRKDAEVKLRIEKEAEAKRAADKAAEEKGKDLSEEDTRAEQIRLEIERKKEARRNEEIELAAFKQEFLKQQNDVATLRPQIEAEMHAERERRWRIEDKDASSFWRKEKSKSPAKFITLEFRKGSRILLTENLNPLQFVGYRGLIHDFTPTLGKNRELSIGSIQEALNGRRGNFVIYSTASNAPDAEISLASVEINGDDFDIINIYTDGVDYFRLDCEENEDDRVAGNLRQFTAESILISIDE